MNDQTIIFGVLEGVLVAIAAFFATRWYLEGRADAQIRKAQAEADRILEEAETRRRDAAIEAKDEAIRLRADVDRELNQRRKEVDRIERRGLVQRETLQRDRRAVTLSTTALGKEIVDALYADVSERMPDITSALPADEQHQLAPEIQS